MNMTIKDLAIESVKFLITTAGTTVLVYAGLRFAQRVYGPIEVTIKEKN